MPACFLQSIGGLFHQSQPCNQDTCFAAWLVHTRQSCRYVPGGICTSGLETRSSQTRSLSFLRALLARESDRLACKGKQKLFLSQTTLNGLHYGTLLLQTYLLSQGVTARRERFRRSIPFEAVSIDERPC